MALDTNSIGNFAFIALHGDPAPPREQLEVSARPAVEGVTVTRTGKRGVPFRMRSQVDQASYETARATYRQYVDLIRDDPQVLIQGGVVSTSEFYKVQVLDVRAVRIGPIKSASGGLNSPSLGWLECDWDLIAILI